MDYTALKNELQTDPAALGYAASIASGALSPVVALLNAVRGTILIDRDLIESYEIINATVPTEWAALSAAEKQRYQTVTGAGQVDCRNANVRATFQAMFGAGTTTRANLTALLTRQGSRAEQLFGAGTYVSAEDIAKALREG